MVVKHLQEAFGEFLTRQLPRTMERAIFAPQSRRQRGETLIQYIAKKRSLFSEMKRVGLDMPAQALGYLLLRDAQLSEAQSHTAETWLSGSYDVQQVAACLRKLERPSQRL